MVKYIKMELLKLNLSFQGRIISTLVIAVALILSMFFISFNHTKVDVPHFIVLVLANIQNTYIMIFVAIFAVSILFARELQDRGYIHVSSRLLYKLFISKIISAVFYIGEILIALFIVSMIIGTIFFAKETSSLKNPQFWIDFTKALMYFGGTWVSLIFVIILTSLVSVILKNQVGTIVTSFIIFILLAFLSIAIVPENMYSITFIKYIHLTKFINYSLKEFLKVILYGIGVLLCYSIILYFLSVKIYSKKEIKI